MKTELSKQKTKIELSKRIDERVKSASDTLGFDKQEIVERAILFYLDTIDRRIELKQEFNEWDMLSDETLANFEAAL
ncbi:hypothetical protein KAH81_00575 [bacterium]|nr:hypothetical protein [bacterium]